MYTPHAVTIYNVSENPDTLKLEYNVTFLRGVFLDRRQAANIEKSGLRDADAATLFIPFTVEVFGALRPAVIHPLGIAMLVCLAVNAAGAVCGLRNGRKSK